jgi:hypothetical protein
MIIRTNEKSIEVKNLIGETMTRGGKSYPALRVVLPGGVTAEELAALCSGALEILDDSGELLGQQHGYTTPGDLSLVIGKITTAEQERDSLAAALAVETAKAPYIAALTQELDDAAASKVVPLYPAMQYTGALVTAGTRINWGGELKRAAVDLWDRPDCSPDNAPELWEDINYRDGYRVIPSPITVGLKFSAGERGWWTDGVLYASKVDGNVYTPDEYPDNWEAVEA